MPRRKDCANCGHPYTYHTKTEMIAGKERVELGKCGHPDCDCKCYEAPKGRKKTKAKTKTVSSRKPRDPQVSLSEIVQVEIVEVITKMEVRIAGKTFPLEVKKDLREKRRPPA